MPKGVYKRPYNIIERFWKKIKKGKHEDDCWKWLAYKNKDGYGIFNLTLKMSVMSHRFSYIIHNGIFPEYLFVLHKCNNPECCNPRHLYIGTKKNNAEDKVRANRQAKGEANGSSKLTKEKIVEIRKSYKKGLLFKFELVDKYNVCLTTISNIINRDTWKHI